MKEENKFDVIIIGSGIGGLTVASLLARYKGWSCLVLEKNFNIGGQTHCFELNKKFLFDVGLHYVGEMNLGTLPRKVMDAITGNNVKWNKMPYYFERFVYPDFTFFVPGQKEEYQKSLIQLFPDEKKAIQRYFKDIKKAFIASSMQQLLEIMPGFFKYFPPLISSWYCKTTQEYLDAHFKNNKLKALITSQWGDFGIVPSKSAFGMHSTIVQHYLEGGWFPEKGAQEIPFAASNQIFKANGQCLTGMLVEEILINEKGEAYGVRARNIFRNKESQEYLAPIVISNAGAFNTYETLVSSNNTLSFVNKLEQLKTTPSAVSLYICFKESPRILGFEGENYWVFSGYEHDVCLTGLPGEHFYYLSFPSLKDPQAKFHTAEMLCFVDGDMFKEWKHTRWRQREKSYTKWKEDTAQSLLLILEKRFPGFMQLVEFYEVATPLTYEFFQGNPKGAFYGLPFLKNRYDWPWAKGRTPVKHLYMTGEDTFCPGIVGAMLGAIKCLFLILGPYEGIKILRKIYSDSN